MSDVLKMPATSPLLEELPQEPLFVTDIKHAGLITGLDVAHKAIRHKPHASMALLEVALRDGGYVRLAEKLSAELGRLEQHRELCAFMHTEALRQF